MTHVITPKERKEWAAKLGGMSEQYLYQCLTGRAEMNPGRARSIETQSGGILTRQMLCQKTWQDIWPELEQAPATIAQAATETIAAPGLQVHPVNHDPAAFGRVADCQAAGRGA